MNPYVPDRGDLVWLQFNPHAGREQAGKRSALVISPDVCLPRGSSEGILAWDQMDRKRFICS
ncbi:type II toxin-antitoxin system PemK/MazF family toxin [Paenibacillus tyrfis]|uniref:type II toxin-antitoxin system PemK/MazF family toxin n=1 Tax=Paenibacillus tyrfis TaxID=1501230 RepID=UPI00209D119B|nr:type II toxin-antitoxin system PemK/MazF family toxin [Paenibacillus tyrfis]MCP1309264.1 type II toxin-antitoxin system PemK/MazF family toxin [Paenibacillus tyrfis]